MRLIVVLFAPSLLAGCALHLHNPADAKQGKAVIETYEKIDVDGVVTTARTNSAAVSNAERETTQKLEELLVRRDIAGVIVSKPSNDPVVPQGWSRLEREARAVLGPLGLLDTDTLAPATGKEPQAKFDLILRRVERRQFAETDRAKLESMIRTYRTGTAPGTLGTACTHPYDPDKNDEIPTPAAAATTSRPETEPERKWRHYVNVLVPACEFVRASAANADLVAIVKAHPEFSEIDTQIKTLTARIQSDAIAARQLEEQFVAARKELAKAQEELAEATIEKKKDEASQEVEDLQTKVAKASRGLAKAFDAVKDVPFARTLVKADLLREVLANFQALGGSADAPAHKVTTELVALLKKHPDVAAPIRASAKPPVNVLLLELAVHRLEYERQARALDTDRDRLALLEARRELMVERMVAWVEVVDAAKDVHGLPDLKTKPLVEV